MPSQVHVDPAAHAAGSDNGSEASTSEIDMIAVMNNMTVAERRRVYALQGLLTEYHAIRQRMRAEISALANECAVENAKLFAARTAIVSGARDITEEEMQRAGVAAPAAPAAKEASAPAKKGVKVVDPVDEKQNSELAKAAASPSGGIPTFWLTAMSNSEVANSMITEKDRDALTHLTNIEREFVDGDAEKGDRLIFHFSPNEYFTNATLTKEYHTEYDDDHGEPRITDVKGCEIHWKSPKKNLTVTVKQKKQRNKKTGQMRIIEREEPCESFFNFFSPRNPDDDDDDDEDGEDADLLEQEMEMDVEVGTALTQMVVPRAIYYYTGEAVVETGKELREQFGFDEEGDEEDEEDEDEDEDEDDNDDAAAGGSNFRNIVRQRGGGAAASGGRGGRGSGAAGQQQQQQQQECKQQ
ncbi:nucleosome assembly protein-like protein [Novymonas esmeraldas]|uniref:Nucleosome assembly protein-like protein n=1 Tax=Novymonas esmeraldas TaxID=1808958 RepID=A0AAW0EWB5_9TRYP